MIQNEDKIRPESLDTFECDTKKNLELNSIALQDNLENLQENIVGVVDPRKDRNVGFLSHYTNLQKAVDFSERLVRDSEFNIQGVKFAEFLKESAQQ